VGVVREELKKKLFGVKDVCDYPVKPDFRVLIRDVSNARHIVKRFKRRVLP
jgi:hypothetical protein